MLLEQNSSIMQNMQPGLKKERKLRQFFRRKWKQADAALDFKQ